MSKPRFILRRARDWVRHDLPEIVFPSSLPDPPGYVPQPKTPLREWIKVLRRLRAARPPTCRSLFCAPRPPWLGPISCMP